MLITIQSFFSEELGYKKLECGWDMSQLWLKMWKSFLMNNTGINHLVKEGVFNKIIEGCYIHVRDIPI